MGPGKTFECLDELKLALIKTRQQKIAQQIQKILHSFRNVHGKLINGKKIEYSI